jgi:hypothetical protein
MFALKYPYIEIRDPIATNDPPTGPETLRAASTNGFVVAEMFGNV